MIPTFLSDLIIHYGLQFLIGLLAVFGAKKIKDAVFSIGKPDPQVLLAKQAHAQAQAVVENHQAASQAESAKTKEEADAALDALADADRK